MGGGGGKSDDKKAAAKAAEEETKQLQMAIAEQRAAYGDAQGNLSPYTQAGSQALGAYQGLLGLSGAGAQQAAINQLQSMPGFQEQIKYGENAILQNASATGGLRGGNTQTALSQFRPMLLNQAIQQQLGQLGGLQQQGFNAASNLNNVRIGSAGGISNAYAQIGQTNANAALAGSGRSGGGAGSIAGGALGGAATGAAIGSVVPGIGTAIGAGVGAVAGGLAGSSK